MRHREKRWWRTSFSVLALVFVLIVLVALEVFSSFFLEGSSADSSRRVVSINIRRGASLEEIAQILYSSRLVEHPRLFQFAARLMSADTKIQAGVLDLSTGQSLVELIRTLTRTKAKGMRVTIREGLRASQIAAEFSHTVGMDSTAFMTAVVDTDLIHELGIEASSLEGYLFPDTYFLALDSEPRRLVARMASNFKIHLPDSASEKANALGLSLHEALTLASIIEWEVQSQSEGARVSSVYHNRLRRGMPLQADPTIAYALGKGPSRLFYRDLLVNSPYNTYLHTGLPPGPINNPGEEAMRAALAPEQTNYLYFVARGDGTHAFSTNLSEHNAAKEQFENWRKTQMRDSTLGRG